MTEIWKDVEGYDGRYQVSTKEEFARTEKFFLRGKERRVIALLFSMVLNEERQRLFIG